MNALFIIFLFQWAIFLGLTSCSLTNQWIFPSSRRTKVGNHSSDWIIPMSRDPATNDKFTEKEFLKRLNEISVDLHLNKSEETYQQVEMIRLRLINDIEEALNSTVRDEIMEPPGFFDSFSLVLSLLESFFNKLFNNSLSEYNTTKIINFNGRRFNNMSVKSQNHGVLSVEDKKLLRFVNHLIKKWINKNGSSKIMDF